MTSSQHAVTVADLPQALEEPFHRRDAAHVAGDRLDDHAGDLVAAALRDPAYGLEVVVAAGERELGERRGDAGGIRRAQGERARAGLDQEGVAVAVIVALELEDAVAPRAAACQADGAHGRFGAGVDHPHLLQRWNQLAQACGHLVLGPGRRAEAEPACGGFLDRPYHVRVGMSGDHRAPGSDVVDIAPTVRVHQPGPLGALDEQRLAPDRAEGTHGRVHPAGQVAQRLLIEFL